MTVLECRELDRRMTRLSRIAKFIRRHINRKLGEWLSDRVYDYWEKAYI